MKTFLRRLFCWHEWCWEMSLTDYGGIMVHIKEFECHKCGKIKEIR